MCINKNCCVVESIQKLTREQKEAVGLLSIGTFLEYFDLMLYVHMAVLLNELFFPKTDPFTASLLSALTFCSTYMLRPFGAFIFGYIADQIGRKATIIITTLLMSLTCIVMGTLPTHAQIGLTSSCIMIVCRMVQGMTATAESRGAELYITESFKAPIQYPLVAMITVFTAVGTSAALGVCTIFTNEALLAHNDYSWRIVFYIGAAVGLVGTVARTSLKEASDYTNKRKMLHTQLESKEVNWKESYENSLTFNAPSKMTAVYYFIIHCARPPCFYFVYIYCSDILKHQFGLTPNQVISQNFLVSIFDLAGLLFLAYISFRVYPLLILKFKLFLFFISISSFPLVIDIYPSPNVVLIYQCLAALFVFDHIPASPIFYKYFPILRRFTYTSLISAFAKLLTYLVTSFGLVFATKAFGYSGIFIILVPVGVGFFISVDYFHKKELEVN